MDGKAASDLVRLKCLRTIHVHPPCPNGDVPPLVPDGEHTYVLSRAHRPSVSMRLLVLGGTGVCGVPIIEAALAERHTVVVYARTPSKLPVHISASYGVVVIKGELLDEDSLSKAMEGVDAVLSALGRRRSTPSGTPLAQGYQVVLRVMQKYETRRLIALATPAIKDENDRFSAAFAVSTISISPFARSATKDIVALGESVRVAQGIKWTIIRVPSLSASDKGNRMVVAGYVGDGRVGTTLTRAGLAAFVLEELRGGAWVGKQPLVSTV